MESQEELREKAENPGSFEERYKIWQCPHCNWLNRFVDTFFETCDNCNADHTLDWDKYIIGPLGDESAHIDYRDLLKKYMAHVTGMEGIPFLPDDSLSKSPNAIFVQGSHVGFAQHEIDELESLFDEARELLQKESSS